MMMKQKVPAEEMRLRASKLCFRHSKVLLKTKILKMSLTLEHKKIDKSVPLKDTNEIEEP